MACGSPASGRLATRWEVLSFHLLQLPADTPLRAKCPGWRAPPQTSLQRAADACRSDTDPGPSGDDKPAEGTFQLLPSPPHSCASAP